MTTTFLIENGDVVVSAATGSPAMVADGTKLRQDLREMLSTEARRNNIGAGLESVIDGQPVDQFAVRSKITRRVRRAVETMQLLQTQHHRNQRPATERLRALVLLQVAPLEGSLTAYAFRAEFATADGGRTSTTGVVS